MKSNDIKVNYKRIREHAKANRWNGHAVAKLSGVTAGTVYAIFRGKTDPSASTLKKICDVIGLPIEDAFVTPKRRMAA